jgi:formylglycine-generating enzyme required for sulfatase activity
MTLVTLACAAAVGGTALERPTQSGADCQRGEPLTERDVQQLVEVGIEDATIRRYITACSVTFILSEDSAKRFRTLGASATLIRLLAPPASPAPGTGWTPPIDSRPMVWIAPGTFKMGSPATEAGRDVDEGQHDVTIERGFWLDVHEVTNDAFRRFVLANPEWQKTRIDRRFHDGNYLKDWNGIEFPPGAGRQAVSWVSWHAARAYAAWAGKRLPTEAEWEFAARAGTVTAYWWGDAFNASRVGAKSTSSVGDSAGKSPWGLVLMLGGLWEWTSSRYSPYPFRSDGRDDAQTSEPRVVRGGFYNGGAHFLRSANRSREAPALTSDLQGFRCAR